MKDDYKDAEAAIRELKTGNPGGVDSAIHFLNGDVYAHRSGYLKEYLWRYLLRVPLSERQSDRLLQVARKYLHRRMSREFRAMCRLANRIANAEFRDYVRELADSSLDKNVKARAKLLDAYITSLDSGERMRIRSVDRGE